MRKDIKGVLVDMDGVLYDSMKYHTLAWQRMMTEAGVPCTREEFYLYEGMTGAATINLLFQREFGRDAAPGEIKRLYGIKTRYFVEMGKKEMMPDTAEVLCLLKERGLPCVLVTGSGQSSIIDGVDIDYPGVFEAKVTASDVTRGKPHPEPYLMGAAKIGISPEDCIVIENAPLGVKAGKAAGAYVIAVTTGPIPAEEMEKAGADAVFPSMAVLAAALAAAKS